MLFDSSSLLLVIHCLAGLAFALGVLFLIFWVWKELKGKKLLNWAIWFLIVGGVVSALTMQYSWMAMWGMEMDSIIDGPGQMMEGLEGEMMDYTEL